MLSWVQNRHELACQAMKEAHGLRVRFGADAEDWCETVHQAVAHDRDKLRFVRLVRRALKQMPVTAQA
jgi:hypothetical protein